MRPLIKDQSVVFRNGITGRAFVAGTGMFFVLMDEYPQSERSNKLFNDVGRDRVCLQIEALGYEMGGAFPFCRNLEDLTFFIECINEELKSRGF